MFSLFKSKPEIAKLSIEQINYFEDLTKDLKYVNAKKVLQRLELLFSEFVKQSKQLFDRTNQVNNGLMQYAKSNAREDINTYQDIPSLDRRIAQLKESLENMKPIVQNKKDIENLIVKDFLRLTWRDIKFGMVKFLPVLAAFGITFFLEQCTPLFESLIHRPHAHLIIILASFAFENFLIDKLLDDWKQNIYEKQIQLDLQLLKKCYQKMEEVKNELDEMIMNGPLKQLFSHL